LTRLDSENPNRVALRRKKSMIKKIAINTGGGDAPGLNAVIQAATLAATKLGWEVCGIREGYSGLLDPQDYPAGGLVRLTPESVRNISHLGGTILGTVNKGNPFKVTEKLQGGLTVAKDRSDELMEAVRANEIDALIAIGGDGSLTIANAFYERGLRVVGVPKTIDNDLDSTVMTFGYQTAVSFATECIDRLHSTAEAHRRIIVIEVMGRYAGWIALNAGIAGRADAILIPEIPYDIQKLADHIRRANRAYSIIVVAEGAKPVGGEVRVMAREAGRQERLGGIAEHVAAQLQELTSKESRAVVLGHLLRGGSPVAFDRVLGLTFGAAAVTALAQGKNGVMVALKPPRIEFVPIAEAISKLKLVSLDSEGVITARALGICLGD
jgi:ATP-dependent phosphofructokinase / diphosphate-dependent phosphofructokinase